MTLGLQAPRDLDGLREVSFVGDLHDVPPASLEVLREDRRDVFDLGGTWSGRALILRLDWNGFFTALGDELAVDGLTLDGAVQRAEHSAAVAELPRVAVRVHHLSLHPRPPFRHVRLVIIDQLVSAFLVIVVRPMVGGVVDQIVLNDLRDFRQRVVSFQDRQRLRQELQRLVSNQLAGWDGKVSEDGSQRVAQQNLQRINLLHHILAHRVSRNLSPIEITAQVVGRHVRLLVEVIRAVGLHRLIRRRPDGWRECRLRLNERVISLGRIFRIRIDLVCFRTR